MVLELGRKEREWEWLAVGLKGALPWRLVYFLFRKFIAVIVYIQSHMGNTEGSNQERFHQRYNFLYALEDRNFGLIKIYRKKQINFDYVMVFERRYSTRQVSQAREQIQNIRRNHTLQTDVSLLRIMNVEQIKGNMCDGSALRIYMEYTNTTLKDMIVYRKECRQPFSPDELMYIIQSALKSYRFLKNLNSNHLALRPDSIFINPEDGMLRFNPIRIEAFPTQVDRCTCLPQNQQVFFEKSQRQFLYELKSLVLDLVEICPQDDYNFRKNYQILANINGSKTIQQVTSYLWQPEIESLRDGKKGDTTEVSSVTGSQAKFGLSPFAISKVLQPDPYSRFR